jgi:hypothetical protein
VLRFGEGHDTSHLHGATAPPPPACDPGGKRQCCEHKSEEQLASPVHRGRSRDRPASARYPAGPVARGGRLRLPPGLRLMPAEPGQAELGSNRGRRGVRHLTQRSGRGTPLQFRSGSLHLQHRNRRDHVVTCRLDSLTDELPRLGSCDGRLRCVGLRLAFSGRRGLLSRLGQGSGRSGDLDLRSRRVRHRLLRDGRIHGRHRDVRTGRRRWGNPRGEQCQRVDIALRIAGHAHPEVDIGLVALHVATRTDRPDGGSFLHERAAHDADRAKVDERRRECGRRLDRDSLPAARDGARERDDAVRRGENGRAGRSTEVDAAVLATCIRVGSIEREGPKHRPLDGPSPALRGRHRQRAGAHDQDNESPHNSSFVARFENETTVTRPLSVVNTGYKVRR